MSAHPQYVSLSVARHMIEDRGLSLFQFFAVDCPDAVSVMSESTLVNAFDLHGWIDQYQQRGDTK